MSIGPVFGLLTQKQREKVIKNVAKRAAERFQIQRAAVVDAFKFAIPRGDERRAMYEQQVAEMWMKLANYNDPLFQKLMADWAKLEYNRMNREISAFNPYKTPTSAANSSAPVDSSSLL